MEGKQHNTRSKKQPKTLFQKTENLPTGEAPSFSGHDRKTAAESSDKTTDQENHTEHGSLTNFDITPLATVLKLHGIFKAASIPSPLRSGALQWKTTGDRSVLDSAQDLYQGIFDQRLTLLEEVKTQADFHKPERSKGLLCWWEYLTITSDESNYNDSHGEGGEGATKGITRDLNYAWVDGNMDLNMSGLQADSKEASTAGKALDICRLRCKHSDGDARPGEFRYFILNSDQASLSINGISISMGRIAGPLPEFAVIGIDGAHLFWWGTAAALNFVPDEQSTGGDQKGSSTDSQKHEGLGGVGNAGPTGKGDAGMTWGAGEAADSLEAWRQDFKQRYNQCRTSHSRTVNEESSQGAAHRLASYTNLGIDDVVLAIGAVRFSLGERDLAYCFGSSDLYAHTRCQRLPGMACGGLSKSFIMPLFFDESSNRFKGEILSNVSPPPQETFSQFQSNNTFSGELPAISGLRHCMLALARYGKDKLITIDFIDSKAKGEMKDLIRETARNLVRNSGWLHDKWPKFGKERWLLSNRQGPEEGDTSGIHTILNAWSVVLNSPLNLGQDIEMHPQFYAEALQVINLGLDGKLDSLTLRSFLRSYQYAPLQDLPTIIEEDLKPEGSTQGLLNRYFVKMNKEILDREIGWIRSLDPWKRQYKQGIAHHVGQSLEKNDVKRRIKTTKALLDEDVFMAIASVWEGLRQAGALYAFGTLPTFRGNRQQATQIRDTEAVLGPNPLIIPLFFGEEMPPEGKRRNRHRNPPIGHHLLAVATTIPASRDMTVDVFVYDSAPGTVPHPRIQEAIDGLVRFTGWMGIDATGKPLEVTPTISYYYLDSPRQEGTQSCGFNLILNAWTVMLGLSFHRFEHRLTETTLKEFHTEGLGLINLALAGHMDSMTIQAFLVVHGYALPNENGILRLMNAVALDTAKLDEIIAELRQRGKSNALQLFWQTGNINVTPELQRLDTANPLQPGYQYDGRPGAPDALQPEHQYDGRPDTPEIPSDDAAQSIVDDQLNNTAPDTLDDLFNDIP